LVCLPFRKYERERKEREIGSYGKMDVRRFWGGDREKGQDKFAFLLLSFPSHPTLPKRTKRERRGQIRKKTLIEKCFVRSFNVAGVGLCPDTY